MKKLFSFGVLLAGCALSFQALSNPVVSTNVGAIEGISSNDIEIFKGIPYAREPIGSLRFAPPEKAKPFDTTFQAKSFCAISPQVRSTLYVSEANANPNPLCLNVYRPANVDANAKLPVYVWIHGGAYAFGSSNIQAYSGDNFAKDNIVFVSFNYRVAAEGFYASQTTYKKYGTTGNWGHLDMIMALQWVHDNIDKFGGDPANVTVGGESSGAFATSALVLSPLAKGLFNKAILQSGTILSEPFVGFTPSKNHAKSLSLSKTLAKSFGVRDNEKGLEELRNIDPSLLPYQCVYDFNFYNLESTALIPYLDDVVVPNNPYSNLVAGKTNDVDIMLGYNTDEGSIFVNQKIEKEQFENVIKKTNSAKAQEEISKIYACKDSNVYQKASEYAGDMMFNLGMKIFADNVSTHNNVYMYHFNYATDADYSYGTGVRHSSEIQYVFKHLDENASSVQKDMAEIMHMRWVNFIKTGNPNTDGNKETFLMWPKYEASKPAVFKFDVLSGIEPFALSDKLNTLESIYFHSK